MVVAVASTGVAFVARRLLAFLAFTQRWFHDAHPWVDAKYNRDALLRGDTISASGWAHLAVTTAMWILLPLAVAVQRVLRSEVK